MSPSFLLQARQKVQLHYGMQRTEIIQRVYGHVIGVIDIYNGAFPCKKWDTLYRISVICLLSGIFFFMTINMFVPQNAPSVVCLLSGCVFNALVIAAILEDHLLWDQEWIEEQPYRAGLYAAAHGGIPISVEPLRHSHQMIEQLYDELHSVTPVENLEHVLIRRCIHRLRLLSLLAVESVQQHPFTVLTDGGQNCIYSQSMV